MLSNKKGNAYNKKSNAENEKTKICQQPNGCSYSFSEQEIFECWNNINVHKHRKLSDFILSSIKRTLKEISKDSLISAIKEYGYIYHNSDYLFDYKWNLAEFLDRGLSKRGRELEKGFRLFLPENEPRKRFLINKNGAKNDNFRPITTKYNPTNILDTSRGTYYGFDISAVKNPQYLIEDIRDRIRQSVPLEYEEFKCIETIIASYLFKWKWNPRQEELDSWIKLWKKLKPKFEKEEKNE